jgi:hypothetical protein
LNGAGNALINERNHQVDVKNMQRILLKNGKVRKSFAMAISLAVAASTGASQTQETVTIKFDDGDGVTGELVEFANDTFKIQTVIGRVTIPAEGVYCIGAACPPSTRLEVAPSPMALTSFDGSIKIAGNLLEIVNGQYVLATDFGELRIDTDEVTCEGEGCLETVAPPPTFGGPVVLTSGVTTIEGDLVGIEDNSYVVEIESMGPIRVTMDKFTCSGEGCPIE